MIKKIIPVILFGAFTLPTVAEETGSTDQMAESMVAGMQKADMTYRELMEVMGMASSLMQQGIIRENKQMVWQGANIIFTHPAPKHKPWLIVPKEDRTAFKATLLSFDKVLDKHTESIVAASKQADWLGASQALGELNGACIACHAMWKQKATAVPVQ